MQKAGVLHRLDLAFSRDQAEKVYVQNRMLENAPELFAWLEDGAHFCVCGDASRMARDVDAALRQVIQTAGGTWPRLKPPNVTSGTSIEPGITRAGHKHSLVNVRMHWHAVPIRL